MDQSERFGDEKEKADSIDVQRLDASPNAKKTPTKRFVGRRTAEARAQQNGEDSASFEDANIAVQRGNLSSQFVFLILKCKRSFCACSNNQQSHHGGHLECKIKYQEKFLRTRNSKKQ